MAMMKAVRMHEYGSIDGLVYEEVAKPQPATDEVLIQVKSAGVNPVDWKMVEGFGQGWMGHLMPHILGVDVAGVVEAVGSRVTKFKAGDAVYGYATFSREGSFAEYVAVKASDIAAKPATLDFVQAAAVPVAAMTSWQGILAQGKLSAGQKILIHAAAGGVGLMAVQLAKAQGAVVIGTASARNLEFVKAWGADEVIDYTSVKFEDAVSDVDVVFDLIGGDTQARSLKVLKKGGILVSAVAPPDEQAAEAQGVRAVMVGVQPDGAQLEALTELIDAGKVKVFVEQVFPLAEAKAALRLNKQGRTRGKIVLSVE
ncbi:MAG: NADP-dependent oxidoreductase [Acidobacteriota bacterium]